MSWAALIALLAEFFGPKFFEWLKKLFAKAAPKLGVFTGAPEATIRELFAAARAETWWWQFGQRARLAVCERIASKRAGEFFHAMREGLGAPVMLAHERAQLDEVL